MRKPCKRLMLILAAVLLIAACSACGNTGEAQSEAQSETQSENTDNNSEVSNMESVDDGTLDKSVAYKVLFIGNSYTLFNDLPSVFEYVMLSGGYRVNVETVASGGYTLERFADVGDEYGAIIANNLKIPNKYDFVFLQEQSSRPVNYPEKFFAAARKLYSLISSCGAETIFYQTWGWRDGTADITEAGLTTEQMEEMLRSAYTKIGNELGAKVSYAGAAMLDVYKSNSGIVLYNNDGSHPSLCGTYLAALTHFATLTGCSPLTIDYHPYEITDSQAEILKAAAYNAVFD